MDGSLKDDPRGWRLGGELEIIGHLWWIQKQLREVSAHMQRTMGVTIQQRVTIKMVAREPGITAGRLAELLHIHPSTLTRVLRRLVPAGLLERKQREGDSRKAMMFVTATGSKIADSVAGTAEAAMIRTLARVSKDDAEAALRFLRVVADELDAEVAMHEDRAAPRIVLPKD